MAAARGEHGWCSLRLRFDERELKLLRSAEQVRGAALAHAPRPDQLRNALNLAKAGHKLGHATAGGSVSLEEGELHLLVDALRYATEEIHLFARGADADDARRRDAVLVAFPDLAERGAWRSFSVARELEALTERLHQALSRNAIGR